MIEEGRIMNSLKSKLQRFMWGRYGVDPMYFGLLGLYVLLVLLQALFGWSFLAPLAGFVVVYAFWRTLSKNHMARRRENAVFLKIWNPIKKEMILLRDRFRDRKTTCYRRCKHCHAILKLPHKKGSHTVVCPKCRERFSVHIFL